MFTVKLVFYHNKYTNGTAGVIFISVLKSTVIEYIFFAKSAISGYLKVEKVF